MKADGSVICMSCIYCREDLIAFEISLLFLLGCFSPRVLSIYESKSV